MCNPELTTVLEALTPQRLSELPVIATSRRTKPYRLGCAPEITPQAPEVHLTGKAPSRRSEPPSVSLRMCRLQPVPKVRC